MILDKLALNKLIAQRVAAELKNDTLVNLGLGLPTMVANYVTPQQNILFQGENGLIGIGSGYRKDEVVDRDVISSSGFPTKVIKGASFFDSSVSFGMIRGGHVDVTVLGTMEVDQEGNIANYKIPGKMITGMGGAMDLCSGAKKVIVATFHTNKGTAKILKKCSLPLTAQHVVSTIVTEMAVMDVTKDGLLIRDYNRHFTLADIIINTDADLIVSEALENKYKTQDY